MSTDLLDYEIRILQDKSDGEGVLVIGSMPEELRMDNSSTWEAPFSQGLLGMLPGSISTALKMFGVKPATQLMTIQVWQTTDSSDLTFDLVFTTNTDPVKDVQKPVLDLMSMVVPSLDERGFIVTPGPTLDPAKAQEIARAVWNSAKDTLAVGKDIATGLFNAGENAATQAMNNGELTPPKDIPGVTSRVATRAEARIEREKNASAVKNRISIQFGRFLFIRDVVIISANPTWNMSYLDGQTGLPNMATVSVVVRPLFAVTMQDMLDMFHVSEAPKSSMISGNKGSDIPGYDPVSDTFYAKVPAKPDPAGYDPTSDTYYSNAADSMSRYNPTTDSFS